MLDQIRLVLEREGVRTAAIVDDVYDQVPTLDDIEESDWNIFGDDLSDAEFNHIKQFDPSYVTYSNDMKTEAFLRFVWQTRECSEVFARLFVGFQKHQMDGQGLLESLCGCLETNLGFTSVHRVGARDVKAMHDAVANAQIVFMDLFLGLRQDEGALERASERVRQIVDARPAQPPLFVLISSSTRLDNLRDDFREKGGLLGCQFRSIPKTELANDQRLYETLLRLTSRYRDTLKLSAFINAWNQALQGATARFLTKARRLDLRDYADLQQLVLDSQNERVGTYMREAYDQFFHRELEGDRRLAAAAHEIDRIRWDDYPPPHFLPTLFAREFVDGLLFFHSDAVEENSDIEFGDVLLASRREGAVANVEPVVNYESGERLVLLVLTQACDLAQKKAKRVLFLAGVARPNRLVAHKRADELLTPCMIVDKQYYVVVWELGAPISWTLPELATARESGGYRRVRRFRPLYALKLQQRFAGSLTRVGTAVMPVSHYFVGVEISYKAHAGDVIQLLSASSDDRVAVVLVGRDKDNLTNTIVLSSEIVDKLRAAMLEVPSEAVPQKVKAKWNAAVASQEFFARLERGVGYDRNGASRVFGGKDAATYDVLQVIGQLAKSDASGPLLIKIVDADPEISAGMQNADS